MIRAIGQRLGVKMSFEQAAFAGIIPGLCTGRWDLGGDTYTDTVAREEKVDVSVAVSALQVDVLQVTNVARLVNRGQPRTEFA